MSKLKIFWQWPLLNHCLDLNTTNCVQCGPTLRSLVYTNQIRAGINLANRINGISADSQRTRFPAATDTGSDYKLGSRRMCNTKTELRSAGYRSSIGSMTLPEREAWTYFFFLHYIHEGRDAMLEHYGTSPHKQ